METATVSYLRVSTEKQGRSGLGLESQRAIIAHYYGSPVAEFVEVESGKAADNRPELERAIQLCNQTGATLVTAKVDRLSRSTEDTLTIYKRLGGRLRACDLPAVDDDPSMFKLLLTLHAALAERERELISIRTRAALTAAKARGAVLGKPGNLTDQGKAAGAQRQKQAARQAYQRELGYIRLLREQGLSFAAIAGRLNGESYRTRRGRPFNAATVYRIMRRNGA